MKSQFYLNQFMQKKSHFYHLVIFHIYELIHFPHYRVVQSSLFFVVPPSFAMKMGTT